MKMLDLKACTVCFTTDVKLYRLKNSSLRYEYNLVSGLHTKSGNGLPDFLCVYCSALVRRSIKFRDKCQRAHHALQDILHGNIEINKHHLQSCRKILDIMPPLTYVDLNCTHFPDIKFQSDHQGSVTNQSTIQVAQSSSVDNQNTFYDNLKTEVDGVPSNFDKRSLKKEKSTEQLNNNPDDIATSDEYSDDNFGDSDDNDNVFGNGNNDNVKVCKPDSKDKHIGSQLEEEYATLLPISTKEAKAVLEVYKLFRNGKHKCEVCNKAYRNEERLKIHSRMHDKHTSGNYQCSFCDNHYKTDCLLQTHMTDKHIYKYVCKKCPEVNFDRISAQKHYISTHLRKRRRTNENCSESRPSWVSARGGKRAKGVVRVRPTRKTRELPDDFLIRTPVGQEEQYQLIYERKKSRNYIDSVYKCEFCFRGFRESGTYGKHMKKHDPVYAGKYQCDMCKVCFRDLYRLSKHVKVTHIYKYSCQQCSYYCFSREQAHSHYKWHRNVTYSCPHCDKVFKKSSTRVTHIRTKHTSTFICIMCGHSFISDKGLYNHKLFAHTAEERQLIDSATVDPSHPCYCADCGLHLLSDRAFVTHLGSSSKHVATNLASKPSHKLSLESPDNGNKKKQKLSRSDILNKGISLSTNCEVCDKVLVNDVQARKHYESEHPGHEYLKRYMCDVCGHVSRQHAHLLVHMRTHTKEKPYECPHCDRRFSMSSSRDRHLVVHTGEKRFECQHCHRRFTQSNTVKLHIQTVHQKIPYAPWVKKNRRNRKEMERSGAGTRGFTANPSCVDVPDKLLLDTPGDYIDAYINHRDN